VSTTPVTPGTPPTIPLTPTVRQAYIDHYTQYEDAIENTNDPTLKASLMVSQNAVAAVISADNTARIQQNTAAYEALLKQMKTTNDGLAALQTEIKKVSSDINTYAGILSGITKVLSLVPGI
jgi:septal ring factor EnvC (AmiA/AmiB activator)